jgi:formylglycine-generating enzyme required for sulfatase activity
MASLHAWRGGTLPDGREQLYAEVLPLLLDRWQRPRSVLHPTLTEYLKTDKQKLERTLQQLAFEAHHTQVTPQGTADIAEDKLAGALLRLCADCPEKPNPIDLKAYLEERAGILTPHGPGVYSFPHRSFQEYLAAGHCCAQSDFPDNLATLARQQPDKWREVCLLAATRSAKGAQKMAWMMVDALFPENADWEPADLWGLRLAAQVIHESCKQLPGPADVPKLERVRRALPRLLASSLPALERAQAGDLLAVLGDPRNGVLHLDDMEFCLVPSGPFRMGGSDEYDGKPVFTNTLDYDYWLARYPVSVAQFREYVTLSGANVGDKDCLAGIDNHPVVRVSWHEAMKFCEWLTARWQAADCLPRNRRATLPSEAEWEKAARGGLEIPDSAIIRCVGALDGAEAPRMKNPLPERIYPWDNAANPNKANYDDTGIGTTSTLGCFHDGVSPCGCEELSGNVWEWCRTEWQEGYRQYQNELPGKNCCVVRGGAFLSLPRGVRCAFRARSVPDDRVSYLGFRVCVSPFLSTSGG